MTPSPRPRRLVLASAGLLAFLTAATTSGPAAAESVTGARVVAVDGRSVTISVPVPRDFTLTSSTQLRATVGIDGRVLPARSAVPATDTRRRAVVMVLDASGSMAGRPMSAARDAAGAYLDALPDGVLVGLVTFADRPQVAARPGTPHTDIEAALAGARPAGGTALYDGVRQALELIPAGAEGRLLVLTDGDDTASGSTLMGATRAARQQDVAVDVVLLGARSRVIADELAVDGSVTSASDAQSLVGAFQDAAMAVAPRLTVTTQVPGDVDAAGARADVEVTSSTDSVTASVVLPVVDSLRGSQGEESDTSLVEAVPDSSAGAASVTPDAMSSWPSVVIAGIAALAVVGLVLLGAWGVQVAGDSRRHRRRVAQVLAYGSGWSRSGSPTASGAPRPGMLQGLDRRLAGTRRGRSLQASLAAADLSMGPAVWLLTMVLATAGAALLLWLVLGRLWLAMPIALVLTPLVFAVVLRSRIGRRQRAFSDELPEFLLLLSSALRAGLSFTQGLESAAEQQQGQVGRQVRRALAEAQLSADLDQALLASAARMDNEDLRWVVTALSVQREVGGNLSVILDTAAATIKGRHALAREVRALSAEGRLSAYVLLALPVGVFGFLLLFRREYVSALWTHPLGIALMSALVILMAVGWIWMRAVVRIRV